MELNKRNSLNIVSEGKNSQKSEKNSCYVMPNHVEYSEVVFEDLILKCLEPSFVQIVESLDSQSDQKDLGQSIFVQCGLTVNSGYFQNLETKKTSFFNKLIEQSAIKTEKNFDVKNLLVLKGIQYIMRDYGHTMGQNWKQGLECLSNIDKLQLLLIRKDQRESGTFKELKNNGALLEKYVKSSEIEHIFGKTCYLEDQHLFMLISSLCEISDQELLSKRFQRTFSLQKIVEIAEYNIFRQQIPWIRIWELFCNHTIYIIHTQVWQYYISLQYLSTFELIIYYYYFLIFKPII